MFFLSSFLVGMVGPTYDRLPTIVTCLILAQLAMPEFSSVFHTSKSIVLGGKPVLCGMYMNCLIVVTAIIHSIGFFFKKERKKRAVPEIIWGEGHRY